MITNLRGRFNSDNNLYNFFYNIYFFQQVTKVLKPDDYDYDDYDDLEDEDDDE